MANEFLANKLDINNKNIEILCMPEYSGYRSWAIKKGIKGEFTWQSYTSLLPWGG